jgi:hypothetical protein
MNTLKLTLLSLCLSLAAFAQSVVSKEGVGEAAVVNKDESKAKAEAKERAIRNAVEQAAGVRIDADTLVVNNQLVRDQIFANTSGYVKTYSVVSESVDKGVATVKVKADVVTESLEKDIAAARDIVKRMGKPKLLIVIQEQTLPLDAKAIFSSETLAIALRDAMVADGWEIKNDQAMNQKLKVDSAVTFNSVDAKEVANLNKVQYVLYGKALMRHQDFGGGVFGDKDNKGVKSLFPLSGEYSLTLAAVDSEEELLKLDGKLMLDTKKDGKSVNITDSYERTAFDLIKARKDEIVSPVRKAIIEKFRDTLTNGRKIQLTVSGLDSFGSAKDFKKALDGIKGVKETTQDSFAEGKASYRVVYVGSTDDLADQFETNNFKKKKVSVKSQTGNTLEVAVGK